MSTRNLILCAFTAATALLAADAPYVGKWKVNTAKSDFAGYTVTFEKLATGEWKSTADGQSYKFKTDGNDYPDGMGDTAAWKAIDANTWQTTWKLNGKVLSTDTLKLSADGALTVATKGTKPNGDTIDDTTTFQRVSGGPGLSGKWKSKRTQSASPGVIEFAASSGNGLTFKELTMDMSCDAKLDGKDHPCKGATLPAGWNIAMTKTGAQSLSLLVKKDGKPMYKYTYVVAPDGKSMTATGGAIATNEKIKIIYDRQ
jgi:hypothetical protein